MIGAGLIAVEPRHHDVDEDDLRMMVRDLGQRLKTVRGGDDLAALARKQRFRRAPDGLGSSVTITPSSPQADVLSVLLRRLVPFARTYQPRRMAAGQTAYIQPRRALSKRRDMAPARRLAAAGNMQGHPCWALARRETARRDRGHGSDRNHQDRQGFDVCDVARGAAQGTGCTTSSRVGWPSPCAGGGPGWRRWGCDDTHEFFSGRLVSVAFGAQPGRPDAEGPPVDADYLHDTQLLGMAQRQGALVANDPQGLRASTKLAALLFPAGCRPRWSATTPPRSGLRQRARRRGAKPLDGMGGRSVFRARAGEPNLSVILETLTRWHRAMAQRAMPDHRWRQASCWVDGEPVDYCTARIPQGTEFRSLAAGGRGRPAADRGATAGSRPAVGMTRKYAAAACDSSLGVIGDWLTEVNVLPTCIRELDAQFGLKYRRHPVRPHRAGAGGRMGFMQAEPHPALRHRRRS